MDRCPDHVICYLEMSHFLSFSKTNKFHSKIYLPVVHEAIGLSVTYEVILRTFYVLVSSDFTFNHACVHHERE